MTKKDKKLFEKDEQVNVDFEQMIYEIVIFAAVFLLLFMIMSIASKASAPALPPIAGVNRELVIIRENAENEVKKERQRLAKKAQDEKEAEQKFIQIFGYVPTSDAIDNAKRVAMAEAGNTESIEGIERVLEVIANRCRSGRFPNTIDEVITQKYQFQTVTEGTIWKYEINDKVEQAWQNILDRGYCVDEQVLFFTAGGYNPYCVPMYKLGNHYFGR